MDILIQQILNALSLGGTYALLALGLAVVFSVLGLINFAHGELMTIAGYTLFFAITAGVPLWLAVPAALAAAALAAVLMERIAFRPLRGANGTTLLLTSFAVSGILQVVFQATISARPRPVPVPEVLAGAITIGPYHLGVIQLLSIVTTIVMVGLLGLFLRRTLIGLAIRAASIDFPMTRMMGIRANAVIATAFAISGLLAGVSGLLWVAQRGSVDPLMGFLPVLKAFIAAILGGIGSLPGAVIGGFCLGFIEIGLQALLPDPVLPFRDAVALLLVILLLLCRPQGLMRVAGAVRP
ncbi:branched-chain amino acid transport system permease protein [Inquilinus ginsengisoli]|uniref:Branched-chain amino acid transport system permease protein n=1 Tax=Inquilinus ginsengisoli TaxID=363840 RepID=A0ABU1JLT0_9PROT|nr:branched-chain amino acid ABC transporter permease [Inquilinus ginsengisoli]MDR6289573.1 branched-chain amino acid transport system permease protein [Inquilinus ginsengisoli]